MPIERVTQPNKEELDHPHIIIDLAYPFQFLVEWAYYSDDMSALDPIIEFFLPLRTRIREDYDVHIVATYSVATDKKLKDGRTRRIYSLSYCPGERQQNDITHEDLAKEFRRAAPQLLNDLQETLDIWCKSDNGLAVFLKEGNKESIRNFLVSIGLRQAKEKPATKEERRAAFIRKHPDLARAAQPTQRAKKKQPT